jgi:hypothetical protein
VHISFLTTFPSLNLVVVVVVVVKGSGCSALEHPSLFGKSLVLLQQEALVDCD